MISLKEIKDIALSNTMSEPTDYQYRNICRWYSKTFFTPLHQVFELPPHTVLLTFFEEGYKNMEEEELVLEANRAIDPNFDENEEKAIEDFIEMIEDEEAEKSVAKSPPPQAPVVKTFDIPIPDDEPNNL